MTFHANSHVENTVKMKRVKDLPGLMVLREGLLTLIAFINQAIDKPPFLYFFPVNKCTTKAAW